MVSPEETPAPPVFPKSGKTDAPQTDVDATVHTLQSVPAPSVSEACLTRTHSQEFRVQQLQHELAPSRKPMFANQDVMKQKVWDALKKPEYNVSNFYHKTGLWRRVATHAVFENLTLVVISINALWIAIDTDNNTASTLLTAEPLFQIVEHFFCWYFSFEWFVRFSAFKRKRDGLKDMWFVFDSCLVFMMVAETWVMTVVMLIVDSGSGSGVGGASILRLFRLLRLSRLARMLRSMPELMILIKGMLAASRSVFFTMCLLVILLYLFAIALRQLTEGTSVGEEYFYSVPASMYKLLIEGVFLDNLGYTADIIAESSPLFAVVFFIFIICAALMVMNMLIGVLCEVVSAVASTEKEEMAVLTLRTKLKEVMFKLDKNRSGTLSEEEFVQLVSDSQAVTLLNEVGVDPIGLIDMASNIFEPDEEEDDDDYDEGKSKEPKEIDFTNFMKIVLDLRGSNTASLKDLREMKHDLVNEIENLKVKLNVSRRRSSSSRTSISKQLSGDEDAQPAQPRSKSSPPVLMGTVAPHLPCGLPDLSGVDVLPLPPSKEAPNMQVEDVASVCSPAARGEARDDVDMLEVEGMLRALQAALAEVQRSGVPGWAWTGNEMNMLDWADNMSKTATSELEMLQRMQKS